ncbi:MAG: hypothetical protein AAB541_00205 [Patescibacteria group bacterium]
MFKNKKLLMALVALLVVIGSGAAGGYYYNQYNESQKEVKRLSNPQEAAKAQVSEAVANVGRLVDLPSGETPTLATVNDPAKLKDQAFFANAKVGDQVLIYTQAKKAILYRPSTNKIIEIAPVNIGASQPATGQ